MKYVRKLVDDYCVLDLETTGLDPKSCEIIEVGILKIRNRKIVDCFSSLINPNEQISSFITGITGISNEMVSNAPNIEEIIPKMIKFIGDDLIVGHNTIFDLSFIKEYREISNEYVDTVQFCKKVYPELNHYRLKDLQELLNLSVNEHRSISDCQTTFELYEYIKQKHINNEIDLTDYLNYVHKNKKLDLRSLVPQEGLIDEDNFFYNRHCCFTGKLDLLERKDAAQLVVNIGGKVDNNVTKKTNYLILGNLDYSRNVKNGKSNKFKKAEEYKALGNDIEIISEDIFYKAIGFKK